MERNTCEVVNIRCFIKTDGFSYSCFELEEMTREQCCSHVLQASAAAAAEWNALLSSQGYQGSRRG